MQLVSVSDFENLKYTLKGNPVVRVKAYKGIVEIYYHRQHRRHIKPSFLKQFIMIGIFVKYKQVSHKRLKELSK